MIVGGRYALESDESAGIGAIGTGSWFALTSNILFFYGLIVLVVGLIKLH